MNRQNFFGHLALAVGVVILAAFVGQMRRMENRRSHDESESRSILVMQNDEAQETDDDAEAYEDAEVIVRFRPGTSPAQIQRIVNGLNDRLTDRFEFINNEAVVADEDGLAPETVAAEYRALPEVEYAEPNFIIELDPAEGEGAPDFDEETGDEDDPPVVRRSGGEAQPNDPLFNEQWSLLNTGQREAWAARTSAPRTRGRRRRGTIKLSLPSLTQALITTIRIYATTSGRVPRRSHLTLMLNLASLTTGMVSTPPITTATRWMTTGTARIAPGSSARKAITATASRASTGKSRSCRLNS